MKRIVIIGGGFAGLSAAKRLSHFSSECEVLLIDKRIDQNFLPLLPDVVGRQFSPDNLLYSLEEASRKWKFKFVAEEVININCEKNAISTENNEYVFDYLIVASGSQTNFYGNNQVKENSLTLETTDEALTIKDRVTNSQKDFVVCGGGYTGVEIATAIRRLASSIGKEPKITLLDLAEKPCSQLPSFMSSYIFSRLKNHNIDFKGKNTAERVVDNRVILKSGEEIINSILVWVAGVKTSDFLKNLPGERTSKGRLKVDPFLRISDRIYVAGDAASIQKGNSELRMSIQFSLSEGYCAADNVIRHISDKELKEFKSLDPGYVVPMAGGFACGSILGINMTGRIPCWLHYLMSAFRSSGFSNRYGVITDWFKSYFR